MCLYGDIWSVYLVLYSQFGIYSLYIQSPISNLLYPILYIQPFKPIHDAQNTIDRKRPRPKLPLARSVSNPLLNPIPSSSPLSSQSHFMNDLPGNPPRCRFQFLNFLSRWKKTGKISLSFSEDRIAWFCGRKANGVMA